MVRAAGGIIVTNRQSDRARSDRSAEFERHAEEARPGLLAEMWEFLSTNKKWWLTPIILVVLLVGALIVLSGSGAAPFIYALF